MLESQMALQLASVPECWMIEPSRSVRACDAGSPPSKCSGVGRARAHTAQMAYGRTSPPASLGSCGPPDSPDMSSDRNSSNKWWRCHLRKEPAELCRSASWSTEISVPTGPQPLLSHTAGTKRRDWSASDCHATDTAHPMCWRTHRVFPRGDALSSDLQRPQ